ncbi:MerR family transcriptional regulator [Paenacidovorax monticola]|uniref:MerR family transcriptional regulator n=1 Tax=Paenacidovorax monticola TaxID=1926868 RepID=A0A7H0HD18_9BURK|nr:MerR family transcriptional regulator [Paenacidovorax monticola]QNP58434.1 MerR family transcriptional regulator [Paenacidovorax monticola]
MESPLGIDDVARRTGLTVHTLRYYERIGLIAPVARAAGGQRRYAASDIAWIEFLLRLRTTNMPIGKMQAFARLRGAGDATVAQRRRMLEAHLADVLAEIEAMRRSAEALQAKIGHYRGMEQSLAPDSTPDGGPLDDPERPV